MADSPGDGGGTGSDNGSSVATADAPTRQSSDQSSAAIDSNDGQEQGDARPPGRPLDSDNGRKAEAREPAQPVSPELGRRSDPQPKSVTDASAQPQDWHEGESVELQADQTPGVTASPAESPVGENPEVEAARADVKEALDRGERIQEARDEVDAAFDQATADGLAPNTKEQFEADFQEQMDEAPTNPDVKQVEYQPPMEHEQADLVVAGPSTDSEHTKEAPVGNAPDEVAQPAEVADPIVSDKDAEILAAEAQVDQAYTEQDARQAVDAAYEGQQGQTVDYIDADADAAPDAQVDEPTVAPAEGADDDDGSRPGERGEAQHIGDSPQAERAADGAADTQVEAEAVAHNIEGTELANMTDQEWQDASPERKQELVQEVSDATADGLGISPCEVRMFEPANPMDCGQYSRESNTLEVSSNLTRDEAINTVVHETRHAYQSHKVESGDHPMSKDWESNFNEYAPADDNYAAYVNQPLEADAWDFESRVRGQL